MRSEHRVALNALIGACAGLLLVSCSTTSDMSEAQDPQAPGLGQSEARAPAPPTLAPVVTTTTAPPITVPEAYQPPPAAVSYPRYGDSDDYLCNFAPPGDPRSLQACIRLRGPEAFPQPPARYGDSDDFVCHHGSPGDPRTIQACLRLRGPEP